MSKKKVLDSKQNNKENKTIVENDNEQKLQQQIDLLKNDLNTKNDQFLRLAAEYDNYRKRSERDKIMIYNNAKSKTIAEILPIADCIESAIKAISNNNSESESDYKKGLKMLYDQFISVLTKMGVESFGTTGDKFDPGIHNAISHIDDENLDENVISQVFQSGYKLGDHVIRHAMVTVAN